MLIDLDKIEPNPYRDMERNPVKKESSHYKRLKSSIEQTQYWNNIPVRRSPDNKNTYQLIFGHHRYQILKELKISRAEFIVLDCSEVDMYRRMILENQNYGEKSVSEVMEAYRGFLEQIKMEYISGNYDVNKMSEVIKCNYRENFGLFDNYNEELELDIKKIINGDTYSNIGLNIVGEIYGKIYKEILKILLAHPEIDYNLIDTFPDKSVLSYLQNMLINKNLDITPDKLQNTLMSALQKLGIDSIDDSQIPKKIIARYFERVQNAEMTPQQMENEIITYIKKFNDEKTEIERLDLPGSMYIFKLMDKVGNVFIKVGFTNRDTQIRRKEIDKGPFEVVEIRKCALKSGHLYEKMIHKAFEDVAYRKNHEWYEEKYQKEIEKVFDEIWEREKDV